MNQPSPRSWLMAIAVTLGFFIVLAMMLWLADRDIAWKDPLLLMLGALIGSFNSVINYFFGSTQTSQRKDETIQDLTKTAAANATTQATQVAADIVNASNVSNAAAVAAHESSIPADTVIVQGENVTVEPPTKGK